MCVEDGVEVVTTRGDPFEYRGRERTPVVTAVVVPCPGCLFPGPPATPVRWVSGRDLSHAGVSVPPADLASEYTQ